MVNFTAEQSQNGKVVLTWRTITELNNQGFEIERLQNYKIEELQSWKKIGYVAGFGTTTETKSYSFTDEEFISGRYSYRLKQIDFDGTFEYSEIVEIEVQMPEQFSLVQNFPNPFNPSTVIRFSIPQQDHVTLRVFDVLGKEVAKIIDEQKPAGSYEISFDGSEFSSGVYFYQLLSGKYSSVKKMILNK